MKMLLSFLLCLASPPHAFQAPMRTQASAAVEAMSLGARYESEAERGAAALYITPDVAFERVHFFFSSALEECEERRLAPELGEILNELEKGLRSARNRATGALVREALTRSEQQARVARCLLDEDLEPAGDRVAKELKLIHAADQTAVSPIMGYLEDYTQYIARGHYTRTEGLERYFRAITWLGRAAFYVEPNPAAGIDDESAARLTAQAILLTAVGTKIKSLAGRLTKFESTMTALFGASDDLTLAETESLVAAVAGKRWTDLEDEGDLATVVSPQLIRQARTSMISTARRPRILGFYAAEGRSSPPLSIRILGQRFSVDSYVFQNLTFDRVQELVLSPDEQRRLTAGENRNGPGAVVPLITLSTTKQRRRVRGMPRGLDLLAALGSKLARDELARSLDDRYVGYGEQSDRLRSETPELLKSTDGFASHYLRAVEFALRNETPISLNSALGAWILLRYDLSAYIKQSYTAIPKGFSPRRPAPAKLPPIYVAPAASVFKELAGAVEAVSERLESGAQAERLVEILKLLANRAGAGALAGDEAGRVYSVLLRQPNKGASVVITDVHSDPISGEALQAALGNGRIAPFKIKDDREATGVIFTCYEFRRASAQRMNDDQWRKELKSNGAGYRYFAPNLQAFTQDSR